MKFWIKTQKFLKSYIQKCEFKETTSFHELLASKYHLIRVNIQGWQSITKWLQKNLDEKILNKINYWN